jgi:predicted small lipoprotein YifL
MKTLRGKTLLHLFLVLVIAVLTVTGCGTSGALTIPPVDTFVIPFEDFENSGTGDLICFDTGNHSNWNYAALAVGIWSTIIRVGLAVPVAAFRESFQHTPVQQDDGSWIWSYSVIIGNATYTAKLHGQFITEGVHWAMNISKEGEYEDFLWYYGECDLPATEGFWILKQSPAVPTDLVRIDWSRNISAGTHAVRYTNIVPGGPENGGYIDTQYTKGVPYDHIWDIYNKSGDNHTYIEWSSTTGEGHVQDLNHFGDDNWHCWDSTRTNVACP